MLTFSTIAGAAFALALLVILSTLREHARCIDLVEAHNRSLRNEIRRLRSDRADVLATAPARTGLPDSVDIITPGEDRDAA